MWTSVCNNGIHCDLLCHGHGQGRKNTSIKVLGKVFLVVLSSWGGSSTATMESTPLQIEKLVVKTSSWETCSETCGEFEPPTYSVWFVAEPTEAAGRTFRSSSSF